MKDLRALFNFGIEILREFYAVCCIVFYGWSSSYKKLTETNFFVDKVCKWKSSVHKSV